MDGRIAGNRIAGYEIGEELGRGPLGVIYTATQLSSGRRVAFRGFAKPPRASEAKWEAARAQLVGLLERHKALGEHPNVQQILDFGEESGLLWVASEFFTGRTLLQVLEQDGPRPLPWTLNILSQIAAALEFAGAQGLAHTDLTPYNVLVVEDARTPGFLDVKVINFGLAHARDRRRSRWAAPEQRRGGAGDRRSDVFSAGVLLFELLSGTPPGKKAALPASLPPHVGPILRRMLAPDPDQRYGSVSEAFDALERRILPEAARRAHAVRLPARVVRTPLTTLPLAAQDLTDRRWLRLQEQLSRDARSERRRSAGARLLRIGLAALVAGGAFWRAATLAKSYEHGQVVARVGSSLPLGTRVGTGQILSTGPGESLRIAMRGGSLLLLERSRLQVGPLLLDSGAPVRRFKVLEGRAVARAERIPLGGVFELAGGEARLLVRDAALAVAVRPGETGAWLLSGEGRIALSGEPARPMRKEEPPEWAARGAQALARSSPKPALAALSGFEERFALPLWEGAKTIASLPAVMSGRKQTLTAHASMQALAALIQGQAMAEGLPQKIDPATLEPLAIPAAQRKKLLAAFSGRRTGRWRLLPGGGWELLARAADEKKTLLRARDGKASLVGRDEDFTW